MLETQGDDHGLNCFNRCGLLVPRSLLHFVRHSWIFFDVHFVRLFNGSYDCIRRLQDLGGST